MTLISITNVAVLPSWTRCGASEQSIPDSEGSFPTIFSPWLPIGWLDNDVWSKCSHRIFFMSDFLIDVFQRIFAKNQIRICILKSGQIFISFRIIIFISFQNKFLVEEKSLDYDISRINNSKSDLKYSLNANFCEMKLLQTASSVDVSAGNSFGNLFREIQKSN